jgi:hypothetical protein
MSACLLSGSCPVPSHFLRLIARLPFTSLAITTITSKKNADCRAQSYSNSERDAERAERVLFDAIFRVINQIFRRATAIFDGPSCGDDAIVDRINDDFLHAFDFGSQLITDFYGFFEYFGLHCYSPFDF